MDGRGGSPGGGGGTWPWESLGTSMMGSLRRGRDSARDCIQGQSVGVRGRAGGGADAIPNRDPRGGPQMKGLREVTGRWDLVSRDLTSPPLGADSREPDAGVQTKACTHTFTAALLTKVEPAQAPTGRQA